ncbi:hypothetical protein EST38_g3753 [Candolleomyces aberdarensis]|uniref:Uncharacterized protein n=1 Tax=Candolleomyces aberdarensis TaxID=2316362 RepID=A0A4Q2DPR9_9AGAR|nr:hypothetical protein EST38_g3753 [Candolleomyces aberdarensis]
MHTRSGNSLSHIRNLRQYVKVTSFGAAEFDTACLQLQEVWKQLQSQVQGETVNPIDFVPYEGNPCIEAHARYFTDRNLIPYEKSQPFHPFVDPFNILTNMKPDVFVHGPDNQVDYIKRMVDRRGCIRHVPCDPSILKAGDLVEIAFSFVAVPIKDKRRLMYLNLKGLTLIDDAIRKESEVKAFQCTLPPTSFKIRTFKRRQIYVDLDKPEDEDKKRSRTTEDREEESQTIEGEEVTRREREIESKLADMNVD